MEVPKHPDLSEHESAIYWGGLGILHTRYVAPSTGLERLIIEAAFEVVKEEGRKFIDKLDPTDD